MCDEGDWGNRNTNQRISMAGTRATSKALRLLLSWVVVLAGYEPTPAEEMTRDIKRETEDLGTCAKHNEPWRVNSRGGIYHKYGADNALWCNRDRDSSKPPTKTEAPLESAPVAAEAAPSEELEAAARSSEYAGMTWADFETKVLGCEWSTWVSRQGTSESALARLDTYMEQLKPS